MADVFLSRLLRQKAVYWGAPVYTGFGGRSFAAGIEIKARWEERQELIRDSSGKEIMSQAVVFVDRDVALGGYLYLGLKSGLTAGQVSDPLLVPAGFPILKYSKIPDVTTGRQFVRQAWL